MMNFHERHASHHVKKGLSSYNGNCYLGIDAGSTTTKVALVGEDGPAIPFLQQQQRKPSGTAIRAREINSSFPTEAQIAYSCSTGYGEALLKAAFLAG